MQLIELFLIAVGLSMDAFAVSICKGLARQQVRPRHMLLAGTWFGAFQALMPMAGYALGTLAADFVTGWSHLIACLILAVIGGNMIREACGPQEGQNASFDVWTMLLLALATSIDALAVGASFAFLKVRIVPAALFIGSVTFLISCGGVYIGSIFGARYQKKAEIAGGVILILIGIKIVLEGIL